MNMIEKVARAIYDSSEPSCEWAEAISHDIYYIVAKAAILAMRSVPDDYYDKFDCSKMWRDTNSKEVWNDWIDAALKEE